MFKICEDFTDKICVVRRLVFASAVLPSDCPHYWDIVSSFATVGCSTTSVLPEQAKVFIENLTYIEPNSFADDHHLALELQSFVGHKGQPLGIVLLSTNQKCLLCGSGLLIKADRPSKVTVYSDHFGTVDSTHYRKVCKKFHTGCPFVQHYGYYSSGGDDIHYNEDFQSLTYFLSTRETAFEMSLLQQLDVEILIGQLSYKQRSEIYNVKHGYDNAKKKTTKPDTDAHPKPTYDNSFENETVIYCIYSNYGWFVYYYYFYSCSDSGKVGAERLSMDRRRLEIAHLKYAVLNVCSWYSDLSINTLAITPGQVDDMIQRFTCQYYSCFSAKYANHNCQYPGCKRVLVLDGNMKNRRDVCMARDAGYTVYENLPGIVKTGCMNSPEPNSRHCKLHRIRACNPSKDFIEDEGAPEVAESNDRVVEMILEKKITRKAVYYKVLWVGKEDICATWVQAKSLSPTVIEEFDKGFRSDVSIQEIARGGQLSFTADVQMNQIEGESPTKRQRTERWIMPNSSGALGQSDDDTLRCNTDKDRDKRLNHHTAGILAGIWPCGIITILSELYVTESKSQVYGALHDFIQRCCSSLSDLRYICYDDGCHLRRFAQNPTRRDITPTAQRISSLNIVVDKMHMAGHVDKWCKENCDARKFTFLDNVDTEICEQTFSWMSRFARITRKMNRAHFMFYLVYISDLHNRREELKLRNSGYL